MPLMARGGMLVRNSVHKLAKSCGPPGCTNATPFTACNGVTPDSLTVTFDGITICTGCFNVPSNFVEGGPLTNSYRINSIDINKSFCLRSTGQNTWLVNIEGDFGTNYVNDSSGDPALDCEPADYEVALDLLQVAVTAIGDGGGGWYYWVTARVGLNGVSGPEFRGVLFSNVYHYTTSTLPCDEKRVGLTNAATDCIPAFLTQDDIFGNGDPNGFYWAFGHGGTADVEKCCQCPSTGDTCCDTIDATASGDADIAGDYTFVRSGNHWNGENGSIIHCVRGRWEMTVKSADGTKSVVWTAGDGITSMDCPPTGDPADWGTPQLNGASSATLESIDCGAANCADCCETYDFELDGISAGYGRSTTAGAVGDSPDPCEWWRLDFDNGNAPTKSLGRLYKDEADGKWYITGNTDGWSAVSNEAGLDCPPQDISAWTVTGGAFILIQCI